MLGSKSIVVNIYLILSCLKKLLKRYGIERVIIFTIINIIFCIIFNGILRGVNVLEFCSLPKPFRSFPSEKMNIPPRMLTHASTNGNVS